MRFLDFNGCPKIKVMVPDGDVRYKRLGSAREV